MPFFTKIMLVLVPAHISTDSKDDVTDNITCPQMNLEHESLFTSITYGICVDATAKSFNAYNS